jgi:cobalt-zinc-cadmium efflux system outer membrane protein
VTYQVENTAFPGQTAPLGIDRETTAFAMLPLEPAYQLRSRIAVANAEVRIASANANMTRRDITLEAVSAFYSTAFAQVEVAALDDNRAWVDSLIRYTGSRVKEGAAAEVDLIRLEVERDRAETDLAIARVELIRAHTNLASLLGTDNFDVVVPAAGPNQSGMSYRLDEALVTAKRLRPEILAADARVDAASAGASLERNSVLRDLGLMTGVKSTGGTRTMIAGVSLPLPIFNQNRGEIQRAEAEKRVAKFDRETAERRVVADVTATVGAVETLSAQLARMQDGLIRRAEEARRVAEGAYREGATPLTQVLDAARALTDSRQLYYRALFARDQALIELTSSLDAFENDQSKSTGRGLR